MRRSGREGRPHPRAVASTRASPRGMPEVSLLPLVGALLPGCGRARRPGGRGPVVRPAVPPSGQHVPGWVAPLCLPGPPIG